MTVLEEVLTTAFQTYVITNDHRVEGLSVKDYFARRNETLPAGCETWATLVDIQIYPINTVGAYQIYAETLEKAIALIPIEEIRAEIAFLRD